MTDERIAAIEARHTRNYTINRIGPDFGKRMCKCGLPDCDAYYATQRLREVEARHDLLFAGAEAVAAEAERLQQRLREVEQSSALLFAEAATAHAKVKAERDVARASEKRAYTLLVSVQPCAERQWLESPNGTAVRLNGVLKDAIQEWVDAYRKAQP